MSEIENINEILKEYGYKVEPGKCSCCGTVNISITNTHNKPSAVSLDNSDDSLPQDNGE